MPQPQDNRPTIRLTIENPNTLTAVEQWADLARALGMKNETPVQVTTSGHLIASSYLGHLVAEEV